VKSFAWSLLARTFWEKILTKLGSRSGDRTRGQEGFEGSLVCNAVAYLEPFFLPIFSKLSKTFRR